MQRYPTSAPLSPCFARPENTLPTAILLTDCAFVPNEKEPHPELNQKARIDFQLKVGSVTDTIEVTGLAPVLKTDDATVGDVVDRRRITELPLNGRNFA